MVKSAGNVVTPQELNMVCGESNEINDEKIVLSFIAEKKIVCFLYGLKKLYV